MGFLGSARLKEKYRKETIRINECMSSMDVLTVYTVIKIDEQCVQVKREIDQRLRSYVTT